MCSLKLFSAFYLTIVVTIALNTTNTTKYCDESTDLECNDYDYELSALPDSLSFLIIELQCTACSIPKSRWQILNCLKSSLALFGQEIGYEWVWHTIYGINLILGINLDTIEQQNEHNNVSNLCYDIGIDFTADITYSSVETLINVYNSLLHITNGDGVAQFINTCSDAALELDPNDFTHWGWNDVECEFIFFDMKSFSIDIPSIDAPSIDIDCIICADNSSSITLWIIFVIAIFYVQC
eukprot:423460_1